LLACARGNDPPNPAAGRAGTGEPTLPAGLRLLNSGVVPGEVSPRPVGRNVFFSVALAETADQALSQRPRLEWEGVIDPPRMKDRRLTDPHARAFRESEHTLTTRTTTITIRLRPEDVARETRCATACVRRRVVVASR